MHGLGEYYAKWNKLNTVWYYLYVEPKKQTSEYNKKETFTDIKKKVITNGGKEEDNIRLGG